MDVNKEDLLEYLQFLTQCEYLSDLWQLDFEIIREQLPKLDVDMYSYDQWLDAVDYLTDTKPDIDTVEGLYEYLLHFGE